MSRVEGKPAGANTPDAGHRSGSGKGGGGGTGDGRGGGRTAFDGQARAFDDRTGLGPGPARAVAGAVVELLSGGPAGVVLELGAGTGEIGEQLIALGAGYAGMDLSRPMLEVFRSRLSLPPPLVQADAEGAWPVRSRSVAGIVASRVAHRLDLPHLVAETARVCRPGAPFLVGRVERDPESVKTRLRQRRGALLRQRGVSPRGGMEGTEALLARFRSAGAVTVEARVVATWKRRASARQVLDGWERVPTMGGVDLPDPVRRAVLADVEDWARRQQGDLERAEEFEEHYTVGGVRLP